MDRILLIDALNAIYRAKVAFKQPTKEGQDFTVVYNFFRQLRALVEEFQPQKVFFCNEGQDSFRRKLYGNYKSNRIIKNAAKDPKAAESFDTQRDIILNLLRHLPITQVSANTFEADDIIASLAINMKDEDVIIVSNDKDFVQLLQRDLKNIRIYNPFKKEFMVDPGYHQTTFLCLNGDTGDDIPSLMGKKKAERLASNPKELIEFLSEEENRANYSLNKQLVELRMIDDNALEFVDYNTDFDRIKDEFTYMDFKTIIEDNYWNRFCETFSKLR